MLDVASFASRLIFANGFAAVLGSQRLEDGICTIPQELDRSIGEMKGTAACMQAPEVRLITGILELARDKSNIAFPARARVLYF